MDIAHTGILEGLDDASFLVDVQQESDLQNRVIDEVLFYIILQCISKPPKSIRH